MTAKIYPQWTKTLPGSYRMVQPHEKVMNGDYMQIGNSYALISDADKLDYDPAGGAFGTYWREINTGDTANTVEVASRDTIARAAFYGAEEYEELDDYLMDVHGYEENGIYYRATGVTLAEYIQWVDELADYLIAKYAS